jgi:2-polyprenyl-3-methyl-5-hydroxy-6-metoxy-1,4-benzoquinol methylase
MHDDEHGILDEQIAYYRARASEYDEWFLRQGRYDRGDEHRRLWFDEVATVEAALAAAAPSGDVLELACGTGLWTRHLAAKARRVTAVDASAEVIAINRARVQSPVVSYVQADLFQWTPPSTYDFVFFGFWLSHVPFDRFAAFWDLVQRTLRPSATVFFVDSLAASDATARDQRWETDGVVERRLNDGQTFRIVKIFHEPSQLAARLAALGWAADVKATPNFFIYGTAVPR